MLKGNEPCIFLNNIQNKTSAAIGTWKCNFLPFYYDDRPTDKRTGHEEVTLLISANRSYSSATVVSDGRTK